MVDFKREAERLMAATTPNREGGIGVDISEWKEFYRDRPDIIEERDQIALWLEGFLVRAIRDIEDEKARAYYERFFRELEGMKRT